MGMALSNIHCPMACATLLFVGHEHGSDSSLLAGIDRNNIEMALQAQGSSLLYRFSMLVARRSNSPGESCTLL
jgi:hypothetical protein